MHSNFNALFQVPEARILKYTESNLDKLRALKREHEVNARATKAAAAKRKQEQLDAAKSIRYVLSSAKFSLKGFVNPAS